MDKRSDLADGEANELPADASYEPDLPLTHDIAGRNISDDSFESYESYPELSEMHLRSRRRRYTWPLTLFVLTCLSTFWAGITDWQPHAHTAAITSPILLKHLIYAHGLQGLIYMGCVLAILGAHEMGHYVATLRHRVPASLPFFIPFPLAPIGTMGAVIGMDGRLANRKQIFDIGIAGPLAGLVVAIPIMAYGVSQLTLGTEPLRNFHGEIYDCPLLVRWMIEYFHPDAAPVRNVTNRFLNPYFMAGWVGFLITGLNMLPVSQLDGGHVIYSLFGRRAHWVARAFILFAITFIVFADATIWIPMTLLVILMGTDHPPTADDRVRLGTFRTVLGIGSLVIPWLCFPIHGLIIR